MVNVVENWEEALGHKFLVFKVYEEVERHEVAGHVVPTTPIDNLCHKLEVVRSERDVPVKQAYLYALELAEKHHFDYIWVRDDQHLFPKGRRPMTQRAATRDSAQVAA